MNNEQTAEIVYSLRLLVDAFEDWSLTDHQQEALAIALHTLRSVPKEIHEMVNEMEDAE